MPPVIEHQKSTVTEAYSALIGMGGTIVSLMVIAGAVDWFEITSHWLEHQSFIVGFITLQFVVFSVLVYYAVRYVATNLHVNGHFVCRMDDDQFQCFSPASDCGETFSIPIRNIAKIERVDEGETYKWYIWNTAGQRFWLTSNYNNPVDKFTDAIRQRCPDIVEIQTRDRSY